MASETPVKAILQLFSSILHIILYLLAILIFRLIVILRPFYTLLACFSYWITTLLLNTSNAKDSQPDKLNAPIAAHGGDQHHAEEDNSLPDPSGVKFTTPTRNEGEAVQENIKINTNAGWTKSSKKLRRASL